MKLLADIPLAPTGGFKGYGSLGLENDPVENAGLVFTKFISSAIGLMSIIAIIWFVFVLIVGAYGFMTAGGDKNTLETSRKKIMNGIVGLAIVVFGIFLIKLIGTIIGLPDILDINSLLLGLFGS